MKSKKLHINPGGKLCGKLNIPGDKSITHRGLILGALAHAGKEVILHDWLQSLDCWSTLNALNKLGVKFEPITTNQLKISSVGLHGLQDAGQIIDVANSGTSMRLLTAILCAQKFSSCITGDTSLCRRPMQRIIIPLTQMGAKIAALDNEYAPLKITGGQKLNAINYKLPIASAQVKSAVLLAGLYATGKTTVIESHICRNHTEVMLANFPHKLGHIYIPGDLSSAAFFIVGASIAQGSDLLLENIGINPTRSAVITILRSMGADINFSNVKEFHGELRANIRVKYASLVAVDVPVELIANAIDELPIICLAAACARGTTVIRGAQELRYKESDRITTVAQGLSQLGVQVTVFADGLAISGGKLTGGIIDCAGDHRIAMTFAMAGLVAQSPIIIQDTDNIATSFPNFSALRSQVYV